MINKNTRKNDIDWLRDFCIILLVFFYAARIFDRWEPYYIKNNKLNIGLSWFIAIVEYWFMALLFYLAGSSSWFSLHKRTAKQYIKESIQRLFIPLLFGLLVIVPPQGYYSKLAMGNFSDSYISFLKKYFIDFSDITGYTGAFSPGQLWFILYLFVFSIISLPLLVWFKENYVKVSSKLNFLKNPLSLIILFIPLTFTEALPSPGNKNLFDFLFIFLLGYVLSINPEIQDTLNKISSKCLIFLIFYVPAWSIFSFYYGDAPDWSFISIVLAFVRNLAVWLTLITVLGYANIYLKYKNKLLEYMNQAIFPIYIMHQTFTVAIGYHIVKWDTGVYIKFGTITILTIIICFLFFEIIKRIIITGWLFGIKS